MPYLKSPENLTLDNLRNAFYDFRSAKSLEEIREKDRKRREIIEQEEKEKAEKLIEEEKARVVKEEEERRKRIEEEKIIINETTHDQVDELDARMQREWYKKEAEEEKIRVEKRNAWLNPVVNVTVAIILFLGLWSCVGSAGEPSGECWAEYTVDC
jgi:Fe2+ transport system protein B